jgi:type IV secretory pathway TraG/TraD family ATPase VirD4
MGAAAVVAGTLYAGAWASARLSGHKLPKGRILAVVLAFRDWRDPAKAWHGPVGPVWAYWGLTVVFLTVVGFLAWGGWKLWRSIGTVGGPGTGRTSDPASLPGLANKAHVRQHAGHKALLKQAKVLRPSLDKHEPRHVGWRLGFARGVPCWMGVRDSLVIVGPPGSGKGLHLAIPMILDAPGAVVTTSTRPDNLAATITARSKNGRPVGVFDPQGLAAGAPSTLRWSPIRGCERAQTAMLRAATFCADAGKGVTDGSFWQGRAQAAIRCMLHAAALANCPPKDLYRWSVSASSAQEAVAILTSHPGATPTWDHALDSIVSAEPKLRESVWSMVANSLSMLGDPRVLEAVTPGEGEDFDPAPFLRQMGTLYLLGTSHGASATAPLVSALVEDVADVARRLAAASPGARLDPPLALILDEAANYPLPSLPSLMSEGGGSGIPTMVVLQSLAQARDRWNREAAQAIWDSATAKLVLGGVGSADDLNDISRLVGEREQTEQSRSQQIGIGQSGGSISTSTRRVPILDPSTIRTLRFGWAVLLFRSSQPIMLQLQPWTTRPDAKQLRVERARVEDLIRIGAEAHA